MAFFDDHLDGVIERGRVGERDHGDARDHDLVDALVAELDDRVDHLLLFGLEDALLAALLDDQAQLLGADPLVGRDVGAEQAADQPGHPGQERHERPEQHAKELDQPARRHGHALGVGKADLLGHELAEDDGEDRQQACHDDERDGSRDVLERPELGQPGLHAVHQADGREGRSQEAQEVDADLDDRQEAARIGLQALDAERVLVALVDQLLEPAAPDGDEGDLSVD